MYTQRMVRTKEYKYVFNPYDKDELYDLLSDKYEKRNVALNPEYQGVPEQMKSLLVGWIKETGDRLTYCFALRNLPEGVDPL